MSKVLMVFAKGRTLIPMISTTVCESAEAILPEVWARLCPFDHPFLNRDFLVILEQHGVANRRYGWLAHHLVATDSEEGIVGVLPLYVRFNSHGDFIYDWSWASAYQQLGRTYYPKLLSGLPHTPAAGPRILVAENTKAPAIRHALIDAAKDLLAEYEMSTWHVALPDENDAALLVNAGLVLSHTIQYHWHAGNFGDFDAYLATFSAEKRRKVKAQRRRVIESGLSIEVRHGDDLEADEWPILHALYAGTFDKFNNRAVFTAGCFADLAQAMGKRMVVFIARDGTKPVAMSLCFRSNEVLYGRYWGCDGSYNSLHFELCFYQGIIYCLRHGLRRFEPGAGGEHKISRGFVPHVVQSAHWIADPDMRLLIRRYLEHQAQSVAVYLSEALQHLPFSHQTK